MKRRLLQTLITCVVMSSLIITPVTATPVNPENAESVKKLQKDVEKLEEKKAEAEAEAQNVNNDLSELLLEYNALQLDMENQEKKIEKAEIDLTEAEEKEKQQYEDMKLRIKYMYEQGDASVIETLVTAEDFTDLVNKAEYVQEVHQYDREQLSKYVETKNEVKELKLDLEAGHMEMQDMSVEMEHQKVNLEATLTEMKGRIDDFDSQLEEAKKAADEELERLREEARRMEEEQRRREEEERRRQEEEQRRQEEEQRREEEEQQQESTDGSSNDSSSDAPEEDDYTPPPSNASLGQQIADMGCRYIGNKYVYGGNSLTNGIDCSGFVQQIHAKFGIYTPRTSSSLRYGGKYVSYSDMLPGDVVCYSGHVAIYIGNNQIVHASNSAPYPRGGIKISSPPNYRTVLAVRRYW